jgi:shikimate kinase
MASGKSTIAKALADDLGYEWIDIDAQIETQEACTIQQLFQTKGEAYFREQEAHLLRSLITKENVVVAAGGGTPCFHDNMKVIEAHFLSVFLKVSEDVLVSRLTQESHSRPLLNKVASIAEFVHKQLNSRMTFYERAHLIVDLIDESVEDVVAKINRLITWKS